MVNTLVILVLFAGELWLAWLAARLEQRVFKLESDFAAEKGTEKPAIEALLESVDLLERQVDALKRQWDAEAGAAETRAVADRIAEEQMALFHDGLASILGYDGSEQKRGG